MMVKKTWLSDEREEEKIMFGKIVKLGNNKVWHESNCGQGRRLFYTAISFQQRRLEQWTMTAWLFSGEIDIYKFSSYPHTRNMIEYSFHNSSILSSFIYKFTKCSLVLCYTT